MRIDPIERDLLRQRALEQWREAKALAHRDDLSELAADIRERTTVLIERADTLQRRADEAVAQARQLIESTAVLKGRLPPSTAIEMNVDRAIDSLRLVDPRDMNVGAALIASANVNGLTEMRDLVATKLSYVRLASNAGTALGLGIVMQPDVAILDALLGRVTGADLAMTLRLLAPQTRILVLIDDPARAASLVIHGIDTTGRSPDPPTLLDWVGAAA